MDIGAVPRNTYMVFCDRAMKLGVEYFFVNGDYIEGKPYDMEVSEKTAKSLVEDQMNSLKGLLPESDEGRYYFLDGNHEVKVKGMVGKDWFRTKLLEDREDFYYIGERMCRVELLQNNDGNTYAGDIYVDILHPQGINNGCVDKYIRQYLSRISKHTPPAILDMGHFHQKKYWRENGISCLTNGAFLKKNDKTCDAGWIVEIRDSQSNNGIEIVLYDLIKTF